MTAIRYALHPGVRLEHGVAVDAARRIAVDTRAASGDPDQLASSLIAGGCAQFDHGAADRIELLAAVLRRRSLAPVRALRLGFARRHAQGGPLAVPWDILMAARLPLAVLAFGIACAAATAVLATGEAAVPLATAAWGLLVVAISMVAHESAHLLTLRALERDRTTGAIEHSWANVWIVGPTGRASALRLTALAGPVAGVAACAALGALGAPAWIAWAVGFVHAANLFPLAPDGRAVFGRAG
jgi:hypothetical protein